MTISISPIHPRFQPEQGVESRWRSGAESPAPVAEEAAAVTPQRMEDAAARIADHFATQRTDLKFRVDSDSGRVVIAVVDAVDGTVLRQIPGDEALRIAQSLQRLRSHLMDTLA